MARDKQRRLSHRGIAQERIGFEIFGVGPFFAPLLITVTRFAEDCFAALVTEHHAGPFAFDDPATFFTDALRRFLLALFPYPSRTALLPGDVHIT